MSIEHMNRGIGDENSGCARRDSNPQPSASKAGSPNSSSGGADSYPTRDERASAYVARMRACGLTDDQAHQRLAAVRTRAAGRAAALLGGAL